MRLREGILLLLLSFTIQRLQGWLSSFFCPITGVQVQGWTADDGAENGKETYKGRPQVRPLPRVVTGRRSRAVDFEFRWCGGYGRGLDLAGPLGRVLTNSAC